MGWIWGALGFIVLITGGVFRWFFKLETRMKDIESSITAVVTRNKEIDKDIEKISQDLKDDINTMNKKLDNILDYLLNNK